MRPANPILLRFLPSGRVAIMAACLVAAASAGPANPNLPLDRPTTQRNAEPGLIERERQRLMSGDSPMSFILPRPCVSPLDSGSVCGDPFRIRYSDTAGNQDIGLSLLGAGEYRYDRDPVWANEAGFLVGGHKGVASFRLDARVFNESLDGRTSRSYDGEAIDVQDADVTGTASFLSYARYRGEMALDLPFGRIAAGRDAAHWGPALMGNLVLNAQAIPFQQYAFTTHLGPVTVHTLYGELRSGGADRLSKDKPMYAHRYELRAGRNVLIGISEQLILVDQDRPWMFVPVFPLFIAKSFMHEDSNNGNLAFDLAWRRPGLGMIYGEFLLDDLESPSSLVLKDYNQNKWALLVGAQGVRTFAAGEAGMALEATRIEPWVYTHFKEFPAQASNLDRPLGNPLGPDILDLRTRLWFRDRVLSGPAAPSWGGWYAGLTAAATWKGTGPGSDLMDSTYDQKVALQPKHWLQGADDPDWVLAPTASYAWKGFRLEGSWDLGTLPAGYARLEAGF